MRLVTIDETTGCWNRGGFANRGYPMVKVQGKSWRAARLAYELFVGPIPEGLTVDHLCRNTYCVNPDHLEPVTLGENARRAREANRPTHCPQGHPYSEHGYVHAGRTHCRECRRSRHAAWVAVNRDRNRELKRESYRRTYVRKDQRGG